MAGYINITFHNLPKPGDSILIYAKFLSNSGMYNTVSMRADFVTTRLKNGQVAVGADMAEFVINFVKAFNLDYSSLGGSGNMIAGYIAPATNMVRIRVSNSGWNFTSISGDTSVLTYDIEEQQAEVPYSVEFTGYNYAASTCSTPIAVFKLSGGTESYNAYIDGELVVSGQPSPIELPLSRDRRSLYLLTFTDSSGTDIGKQSFKTPEKLSSDKIGVDIRYTEYGATISIEPTDFISKFNIPYSYSLDGTTFIEGNVFTGQAEGDYTAHVKDAFGCVTSKNFTVDGVSTTVETNLEISDINPIRYSIIEDGKKNRYNTLSHEQLKNVAYPFIQHFTDKDNPITQIKTNARYLNIFAFDCDGNRTSLTPVKRSNHIGRKLKTTATQFSTEDGRLGVYFGVVDVLDSLTNTVIESKDYGYQIPNAFNRQGGLVILEYIGMVSVSAVAYDDNYEAFILKFNTAYTGLETQITVEAQYNIQNYEIYEFVAPISQLPESFNIVVEAGQSAAEIKKTFISEKIEKTKDSEALAEIIYWNTKNLGNMNYATGVAHTLRLHSVLSRLNDTQTVQGYNGDTERYNTNHEVFDGEEFIFGYLSEEMARKLRLILTHDRLFINGVMYQLGEDPPELNARFTTNICELSAVLSKGGDLTGFDLDVVTAVIGEGTDKSTYELENAIAAAKGKALILWKKS